MFSHVTHIEPMDMHVYSSIVPVMCNSISPSG